MCPLLIGILGRFELGIEAARLALAYEYDPFFSLSVARIDPLPHQLEAFDEQGEKISDVVFSDAEIHVSADQPDLPPAIFACLFYMH